MSDRHGQSVQKMICDSHQVRDDIFDLSVGETGSR